MAIKLVEARCLNCKEEVKAGQSRCRKCGDPVRIGPPVTDARTGLDTSGLPVTPTFAAGEAPPPGRALSDSPMSLTGQQQAAIQAVRDWYEGRESEPFRLFGPAGTGKTTIAKHIAQALGVRAVFGAYTGKAAHVLRKKGVPAKTIHSSIYMLDMQMDLKKRRTELERELAEIVDTIARPLDRMKRADELTRELDDIEAKLRRPAFSLNPESEWGYADLIVLDEVSMVNQRMAMDIESFAVPVLVLGDPAQLPPIESDGYYTSTEPDFMLTEVHRQALESPVLRLATDVREGRGWADHLKPTNLEEAMGADQVLVWKNSTRWSLIQAMRQKLGRPAGVPVAGDRIMCLVNNKDIGVLNGQQFDVLSVVAYSDVYELVVLDEDGHERELLARAGGFQGREQEEAEKRAGAWRGTTGLFTFANAITVHKAQGSEWSHVYVVDQTDQMWKSTAAEKRAWMYTAISRASDRVTLASTGVR